MNDSAAPSLSSRDPGPADLSWSRGSQRAHASPTPLLASQTHQRSRASPAEDRSRRARAGQSTRRWAGALEAARRPPAQLGAPAEERKEPLPLPAPGPRPASGPRGAAVPREGGRGRRQEGGHLLKRLHSFTPRSSQSGADPLPAPRFRPQAHHPNAADLFHRPPPSGGAAPQDLWSAQ